ncbi:ceramide glucosyltransferase-like [Corticium candelabrum]|uniref:ceramide glucosyltransferase-like n=1 Tax=Corticium candelabrum TaxID=121492 RepID=UPI002E2522E0|nr:ceramide glucosyltransferase-like [Corticium candelabrum]
MALSELLFVSVLAVWAWYLLIVHGAALIYAHLKLHRSRQTDGSKTYSDDLPFVSLIKPLLGDDGSLRDNLTTFFQQDYPQEKFEILFCVMDETDPAIEIINQLRKEYPKVQSRLFLGGKCIGVNPKINNMITAFEESQYEFIWICDSSIMVSSDNLLEMVTCLDPGVGIVHQLPFTGSAKSFGAILDKVYFGTQHARVYLVANLLGRNCANGMSWLIRKQALDEIGGLAAFSDFLAEDFFIGKTLWERGWRLVLCSLPALQNRPMASLSVFKGRMVRWTRLRASMMPFPGLLEPLTECLFLGLLGSWAASQLLDCNFYLFFLTHCFIWFLSDLFLLSHIERGEWPSFVLVFLAWLLRETWTTPIFLESLCSQHVAWRGQLFQLHLGGRTIKLQ